MESKFTITHKILNDIAFGLNSYQIKDLLVAHKLFTKDFMKESGEFRTKQVAIYSERILSILVLKQHSYLN